MELASEKELEDMLYNYLKENQGKAYTIVALRKRFEAFTLDPHIKDNFRKNLLTILNKMRDNGIIRLTQHEGKSYYFMPKLFNSSQDEVSTQYFAPEIFISAETDTKKIKKKFCKRCKKEVIAQYRDQKGVKEGYQLLVPILASLTQKSIEARANTGWFCPNCGERLATLYRKVKIIAYFSCVILTGFLIISTFFTRGELQWSMFVLAIFFSIITIFLTVRQLIRTILKKRGRKILDKMKDKPKEYLDRYVKKTK